MYKYSAYYDDVVIYMHWSEKPFTMASPSLSSYFTDDDEIVYTFGDKIIDDVTKFRDRYTCEGGGFNVTQVEMFA